MRTEGRKPSKEGKTRPESIPEAWGNGGEGPSEDMESRTERGNTQQSLVDEASEGREMQDGGVPKPSDAGENGQAMALVLKELKHQKDEFQRMKRKDDDKCTVVAQSRVPDSGDAKLSSVCLSAHSVRTSWFAPTPNTTTPLKVAIHW